MYAIPESDLLAKPMGCYLVIEQVSEDGRVELGRLESGEVTVGREPGPLGVTVENTAVSRHHGMFVRHRDHWFYRDLGSTNGSWVNGNRVEEGQWKLIRSGDVVQVADTALQLRADDDAPAQAGSLSSFPNIGGRSLIVFSKKGEFFDEYPVPEYGRGLVIGGANPDLEIEGDLFELPSLVIERRGEHVCAYSIAKEFPVYINGRENADLVQIKDADEIRISDYVVLFNDPSTRAQQAGSEHQGAGIQSQSASTSSLKGWADDPKTVPNAGKHDVTQEQHIPSGKIRRKAVFGQNIPDGEDEIHDDTTQLDLSDMEGTYGMHPSMRSAGIFHQQERDPSSREYTLTSLEDKIILGFGFLLLVLLMVLVIWWALS